MFVTLEKNKGLFHPIYKGITASVSFVSLTLVVLTARFPDWLRRTQANTAGWERINTDTVTLFQSETLP